MVHRQPNLTICLAKEKMQTKLGVIIWKNRYQIQSKHQTRVEMKMHQDPRPPPPKRKGKERERREKEGKSVHFWCYDILAHFKTC